MFIIAYIIEGFATVLSLGLTIYYYLLLARVLMSWVNPDPYNQIVVFLRQVTDPILEPLRQIFLPLTMQIRVDLSPIIAFFIIVFLQKSLVGILFHIADMLK
jgi:YggT family protein